jgi:hypothetical protein
MCSYTCSVPDSKEYRWPYLLSERRDKKFIKIMIFFQATSEIIIFPNYSL